MYSLIRVPTWWGSSTAARASTPGAAEPLNAAVRLPVVVAAPAQAAQAHHHTLLALLPLMLLRPVSHKYS
jgi:hypothetical protein